MKIFKDNHKKINAYGFSLVEVLIAIGLVGALSVFMMRQNLTMTKSSKSFQSNSEITLMVNEIATSLAKGSNCSASFLNLNAANTPAGTINSLNINGAPRYQVNTPIGSSGVIIESYALSDAGSDVDVNGGTTELIINFNRGTQGFGTKVMTKNLKINIETDASGAITSCSSFGLAGSRIWQQHSSGDIFYEAGNISVGKDSAQVALDVAGGIRPGNETNFSTCDGSTEGSFRYNTTVKNMEYCGGDPIQWRLFGAVQCQVVEAQSTNLNYISSTPVGHLFKSEVTPTCPAGTKVISCNAQRSTTLVAQQTPAELTGVTTGFPVDQYIDQPGNRCIIGTGIATWGPQKESIAQTRAHSFLLRGQAICCR